MPWGHKTLFVYHPDPQGWGLTSWQQKTGSWEFSCGLWKQLAAPPPAPANPSTPHRGPVPAAIPGGWPRAQLKPPSVPLISTNALGRRPRHCR